MELPEFHQNELIEQYVLCVSKLQQAVDGLSEDELNLADPGGGWSIRGYLHHIADGDDLWKLLIKQALGNPQSVFHLDWYWQIPQDDWAVSWAYDDRAVAPSLALFAACRAHISQLLRQIPGALEKQLAVCTPDGKTEQVTVAEVVAMQTRHIDGHIEDIQRILEINRVCREAGDQG